MLETTHIAGESPNRELIYELRQLALRTTDLIQLLDLIAVRLAIPAGEIRPVLLIAYLTMAFGVGIAEGKRLVATVEHGADGYTANEPLYVDAVAAQIEANKSVWSQYLVAT